MQNRSKSEAVYFPALDGLRLLASLNIVVFHLQYSGAFQSLKSYPIIQAIIGGPAFHASLFFILGGFVIGIRFRETEARTFKFIKSRLQALYPLHLITTLIMLGVFLWPIIQSGKDLPFFKIFASLLSHLSLTWSFWPTGTYSLNTPSWALSAFFFCYLLFFPTHRKIKSINSSKYLWGILFLSFLPSLVWGLYYGTFSFSGETYLLFHIFAPVRFFEFFIGMILARLWTLDANTESRIFSNLTGILALALIGCNLYFRSHVEGTLQWLSYHCFMLPLYSLLIWNLSRSTGPLTSLFSNKWIAGLGKSSFYPYLIHIPLVSLTIGLGRVIGYPGILKPIYSGALFLIILYGTSYLIFSYRNPEKSARYKNER